MADDAASWDAGMPRQLGERIRERRRHALLTQEDLAERSGISVRCIRMIESGRGGLPRFSTLRLLDAALTAAVAELSATYLGLI